VILSLSVVERSLDHGAIVALFRFNGPLSIASLKIFFKSIVPREPGDLGSSE